MAESKPVQAFPNRRLQRRYVPVAGEESTLRFLYPSGHGAVVETPVRDISLSGLSLTLPRELPGLRVGDILRDVDAQVGERSFRGDLLVMHLTPGNEAGAICGGLVYPEGDEDLITIRLIVRVLDTPR
jgi:hypothetical protein